MAGQPVMGGGRLAWATSGPGREQRRPGGSHTGQDRYHRTGERAAEHDVVDDVRHLVGGRVRGSQAMAAHRVREDQLAAEAHHPGDNGDATDERRRTPDPPANLSQRPWLGHRGRRAGHGDGAAAVCPASSAPAGSGVAGRPGTGAAGTGRRPSMSSHRSAGVRSITAVKLTFSLAAVSPAIPASSATRAGLERLAAAATPRSAPSALAPASPSIARSPRSSPSSASAAPSGAATAWPAPRRVPVPCPAGAAAARSTPPAKATLMARPGRRSNRFSRLAPPATRPALIATSAGAPPSTAAATSPVPPMPPSLTAPVVTSP